MAWVFIVLSSLATLVAVMQNIMIWMMLPPEELRAATQARPAEPWFFAWIAGAFHFVFLGFLVLCATMLAASIGLLRRRNWARLTFIGLLALGILWNVVGIAFMLYFFFFGGMPVPHAGEFGALMYVMAAFNTLFVLAFVALFAWIIKRLVSPEIRREFGVADG